jgi:hypothetical protein
MSSTLKSIALGVMLASLASISVAEEGKGPVLATQHVFQDWATACDNGGLCRAVSLQGEKNDAPNLRIVITPPADAKAPIVIEFYPAPSSGSNNAVSLFVDKAQVLKEQPADKDGAFYLTGKKATEIARILTRGKIATIRDKSGAIVGAASLKGSNAALRKMDMLQGRDGTSGAIAARGTKKFRGKAFAPPMISVEKPGPEDSTPEVTAIVALAESSACAKERSDVSEDRAYSLGNGGGVARALVLIECGRGPYNVTSAAYVGEQKPDKSWQFAPAKFDLPPVPSSKPSAHQFVVNADWDASKRILGSNAKSRAINDCGLDTSYVWDGKIFRLVEATGMEVCRGTPDWLPLWQASIKYHSDGLAQN